MSDPDGIRAALSKVPEGYVGGINRLMTFILGVHQAQAQAAAAGPQTSTSAWVAAGHSLTAITVAAAAVEASVGEYLAAPANRKFFAPENEQWSTSLPRPPQVIKTILKKRLDMEVGSLIWFDRLTCLFELRNALVHYRPGPRPLGTFPEGLDACVRKHALKPSGDDTMDWTSRLLTPEVAGQAAGIALAAINAFYDLLEPDRQHV